VNRAFPFVSSDEADDIIDVQTPVLFQLVITTLISLKPTFPIGSYLEVLTKTITLQVHSKNFNVGVQALMLLDKISSKNQIASDRFYRALYSKLLLPAAMNTSKVRKLVKFSPLGQKCLIFYSYSPCRFLLTSLFSGRNVYCTYSKSNEKGC